MLRKVGTGSAAPPSPLINPTNTCHTGSPANAGRNMPATPTNAASKPRYFTTRIPTDSPAARQSTPDRPTCRNESVSLSMNSSTHATARHCCQRAGSRRNTAAAHAGPMLNATAPTSTTSSTPPMLQTKIPRPPVVANGATKTPANTSANATKSNSTLMVMDDTQASLRTPSPRFSNAQYISSPARAGNMSTNILRANATPNIRAAPGGSTPAPPSNKRYRTARNHPCPSCAAIYSPHVTSPRFATASKTSPADVPAARNTKITMPADTPTDTNIRTHLFIAPS